MRRSTQPLPGNLNFDQANGRSNAANERVQFSREAEAVSQIGRPCKQCGSPIDKPQGRRCRKCYNRYYSDKRRVQFRVVVPTYPKRAPDHCTCGMIECDTCGDRMLQSLLDKRPPQPTEERSWVGVPQFT